MKRCLPLLCLSMLFLLSACSNDDTVSPQPDISSVSTPEINPENSEIAGTGNKAEYIRQNLLEEAEGPVPDFLDAEQQALYRMAKTAFMEFTLDNSGFGSRDDDSPVLELDEMQYRKCNGTITKFDDFEASMLSVFTAEYFEELNNRASYTDGDGVFHKRTIFAEHDGELYYSAGARGSKITFVEPETFEPKSQSDNELQFYVVGVYDDFAYDKDGNVIRDSNGELMREGNPIQEKHLLTMKKGPDGWRFSEFQLAY